MKNPFRYFNSSPEVIGNTTDQIRGYLLNNRAENSPPPFRRRKEAMAKFRSHATPQKFASIQASVHTHFNHGRYLNC